MPCTRKIWLAFYPRKKVGTIETCLFIYCSRMIKSSNCWKEYSSCYQNMTIKSQDWSYQCCHHLLNCTKCQKLCCYNHRVRGDHDFDKRTVALLYSLCIVFSLDEPWLHLRKLQFLHAFGEILLWRACDAGTSQHTC